MKAWKPKSRKGKGEYNTVLQWGHAGEGVETAVEGDPQQQASWLQWGHAGEGVETSPEHSWAVQALLRFNGATPVKAWKQSSSQRL